MGPAMLGVLIALVTGLLAGGANQRAKRARLDYRRTKSLIPAARKIAWSESIRGVRVLATAAVVMLTLAWVMNTLGQR
jgi:hypothetical protein